MMDELIGKSGKKYFVKAYERDPEYTSAVNLEHVNLFLDEVEEIFDKEWVLNNYFGGLRLSRAIKEGKQFRRPFNVGIFNNKEDVRPLFMCRVTSYWQDVDEFEIDVPEENYKGVSDFLFLYKLIPFLSSEFGLKIKIKDKEKVRKILLEEYVSMKERSLVIEELVGVVDNFLESDYLKD